MTENWATERARELMDSVPIVRVEQAIAAALTEAEARGKCCLDNEPPRITCPCRAEGREAGLEEAACCVALMVEPFNIVAARNIRALSRQKAAKP